VTRDPEAGPPQSLLEDVRIALATSPVLPADHVGRFLAFLSEHGVAALGRDLRVGHLTASTLLLDDVRERVLLTLHPLAGRWFQLGGHLEPGDTSIAGAARREAQEESGIRAVELLSGPIALDQHPTVCRDGAGTPRPSSHLDVKFAAAAAPGSAPSISEESVDLAWFPLDRLPAGADPAVRALVALARHLGLA
jgi:8-oxo-dGTP pyrophosphatase MutT (NUDIX family)